MNPDGCDEFGVPWHGSTRRDSPYFFPHVGTTILYDGRLFVEAGIVEFHRKEGWLLVRPWYGGPLEKVYGKVEVFRMHVLRDAAEADRRRRGA